MSKDFEIDRRSCLFGLLGSMTIAPVWSSSSYAQKSDAIEIRWGSSPAIELVLPVFVAMKKGYLAEEGLKLDRVTLAPGVRLREAMAAGELDFAENASTTYILGRQAGLAQKIIFQYFTKEIFSLFAPTKHQSTIKTVADLKGKIIAVAALGTSAHMSAINFVNKAGLKPTDVTFVGLNSTDPATLLTAVDQFDAIVTWEPISTLMVDRKAGYPLVDIAAPGSHEKWIGNDSASEVLWVSEEMIAKRPEVIQRSVNALKKAMTFIRNNSPQDVAAVGAESFKMDPTMLARILERTKQNFSADGRISRAGMETAMQLLRGGGLLKKEMKFEDMVDTRFAGETA